MDEKITVELTCYSEKTGDSIGCGVTVDSTHPSANEIVFDDFEDSLEESFWELLCDFENSAQHAFNKGEITGTSRDELVKVFGHFHFSYKADDAPIDIDLGIDPDEFMYPLLTEYLVINEE